MAAMEGAPVTLPGQGLFLVGEFLRAERLTRRRTDGTEFERFAVKLLVAGEYPRTVEYPADGLPQFLAEAERGDIVALEVFGKVYRDKLYWNGVTD